MSLILSGNAPAFSAYAGSAQSLSAGVDTKLQLNTEEFDVNNNFDSATNYRFTPTIAGYYQLTGACTNVGVTATYFFVSVFKNGSLFKNGVNYPTSSSAYAVSQISCLVYFNGSTDYVELYATSSATVNTVAGASRTYFQGFLARSA